MRIHCDQCTQALDLPPDKIPDRRFSVTCPSCGHKIVVDPAAQPETGLAPPTPDPLAQSTQGAATDLASAGSPEGSTTSPPATSTPASDPSPAPAGPENLLPLRGIDRQLMSTIPQSAAIVHVDVPTDPSLETHLKSIGMLDIHHAESIEDACEYVQENEVAVLLVRMAKASAPPCEPLRPVYRLPFETRRSLFVALVADNVKTLDGQVAFYLQVNCLINAADLGSMPAKLRRALIHHLRLYRHWPEED